MATDMDSLDASINTLQSQIAHLQTLRANLSTTLLSTPQTRSLVSTHHSKQRQRSRSRANPKDSSSRALKALDKQSRRNAENIHRACAGITAYKVKDPDPYAIDKGNVLGVRIEVFANGTFLPPYHLLLIRPKAEYPQLLKVHKHTIPPHIPLAPLLAKYLPQPTREDTSPPTQNLHRLVRALRKELVGWHLRKAAVEKLREEADLPDTKAEDAEKEKPELGEVLNAYRKQGVDDDSEDELVERRRKDRGKQGERIVDISVDVPVRELTMRWKDGTTGKMSVTKSGVIEKAVIVGLDGIRVPGMGKKALGRIEGLVKRISDA